jgi:TM2 domain-containing membrane protein YozV
MRKRRIAIALAFFLGTFGVHRFYLGQVFRGIVYCVFFSTGVPTILGIIDALVFMGMGDDEFNKKFNKSQNKNEKYDKSYNREAYKSVPEQQYQQDRPTVINRNRKHRGNYSGQPASEAMRKEAIKLFREFRYTESIDLFEKVLQDRPKDPSVHFNLACAYSLTENAPRAFFHLAEAMNSGFREKDSISTHEALAFLRIQPGFEQFRQSGYSEIPAQYSQIEDTNTKEEMEIPAAPALEQAASRQDLLEELRQLERLKLLGVLSEKEYEEQKKQLSS